MSLRGWGDLAGIIGVLMSSLVTGNWTERDEARLAEFRQDAIREGLAGPGAVNADDGKQAARAVVAMITALAAGRRLSARSASPREADRPTIADIQEGIAEAESALELVALAGTPGGAGWTAQLAPLLHVQAAMLLTEVATATGKPPNLLARISAHADQIPDDLGRRVRYIGDVKVMLKLFTRELDPLDKDVVAAGDQNRNIWDQGGADFARGEALANQADATHDPKDMRTAIEELQMVWIGLPTGSEVRGRTLTMLGDMQLGLAAASNDLGSLPDAIATAITALRVADRPRVAQGAACILVDCLTMAMTAGQFQGPVAEAEEELRLALARFDQAGPAERASMLAAVAAAVGTRATALDDQSLREASRRLAGDAERTLPDTAPSAASRPAEWLLHHRSARVLLLWTAVRGFTAHDQELLRVALRVAGKLERYLAAGTGERAAIRELAGQRKNISAALRRAERGQPPASWQAAQVSSQVAAQWRDQLGQRLTPAEAARLARLGEERAIAALGLAEPDMTDPASAELIRAGLIPAAPAPVPDPEPLTLAIADLRAALSASLDSTRARHRVHELLGRCLARLPGTSPEAGTRPVLDDAIGHLSLALVTGEYTRPTTGRADLLDLLARCYREAGRLGDDAVARHRAERAALAAMRELATCVLIADSGQPALEVAVRANKIAARTVGWCLADGRAQAAVAIAESGRALVLASVTQAGRVEELLRGAGEHAAADAWAKGAEEGGFTADRAAALDTLLNASGGASLLAPPTDTEVSGNLIGTQLDAVVYLVPPDEASGAGASGHALLVRPVDTTQIEVVELPGLASLDGSPLSGYLAALERGTAMSYGPAGDPAWTTALDALGQWAYDAIMGPLIGHARGWRLDWLPRLAVIPLGDLGAIPLAAAWTSAGLLAGASRRYAIEDVVLSYAASARLLGEVARRPRQPLGERAVFIADPTGTLHFTRQVLPRLASRMYPGAEVYGRSSAPSGLATTDVILGALPGSDRQGASLLHLATHGDLNPVPAVRALDGALPLARVLRQARGRAPDAPGGLVITSACLTDVTLADFDESLTLATAFLAAGATAVIATRWPVDQDPTLALAVRLHHHLRDGHAPAEALRRAQLDLLRPGPAVRESLGPQFTAIGDERLSHPASWAGHVHHGI
jgi:hypothetical protein